MALMYSIAAMSCFAAGGNKPNTTETLQDRDDLLAARQTLNDFSKILKSNNPDHNLSLNDKFPHVFDGLKPLIGATGIDTRRESAGKEVEILFSDLYKAINDLYQQNEYKQDKQTIKKMVPAKTDEEMLRVIFDPLKDDEVKRHFCTLVNKIGARDYEWEEDCTEIYSIFCNIYKDEEYDIIEILNDPSVDKAVKSAAHEFVHKYAGLVSVLSHLDAVNLQVFLESVFSFANDDLASQIMPIYQNLKRRITNNQNDIYVKLSLDQRNFATENMFDVPALEIATSIGAFIAAMMLPKERTVDVLTWDILNNVRGFVNKIKINDNNVNKVQNLGTFIADYLQHLVNFAENYFKGKSATRNHTTIKRSFENADVHEIPISDFCVEQICFNTCIEFADFILGKPNITILKQMFPSAGDKLSQLLPIDAQTLEQIKGAFEELANPVINPEQVQADDKKGKKSKGKAKKSSNKDIQEVTFLVRGDPSVEENDTVAAAYGYSQMQYRELKNRYEYTINLFPVNPTQGTQRLQAALTPPFTYQYYKKNTMLQPCDRDLQENIGNALTGFAGTYGKGYKVDKGANLNCIQGNIGTRVLELAQHLYIDIYTPELIDSTKHKNKKSTNMATLSENCATWFNTCTTIVHESKAVYWFAADIASVFTANALANPIIFEKIIDLKSNANDSNNKNKQKGKDKNSPETFNNVIKFFLLGNEDHAATSVVDGKITKSKIDKSKKDKKDSNKAKNGKNGGDDVKIDDFGKIKVSSDNTEISKNCEWQRDMIHSFANTLDTKTLVFNVQPSENNIPVSRILYYGTPIDTDSIVNNANKIIFEKPLCENILSTENSYCYNQNYDYQNELIIADAEAEKAKAK